MGAKHEKETPARRPSSHNHQQSLPLLQPRLHLVAHIPRQDNHSHRLPSQEDGQISKETKDSLPVLREQIRPLTNQYESRQIGIFQRNLIAATQQDC